MLNCTFVSSSGRFIGIENHLGGNSTFLNFSAFGTYIATSTGNYSLLFNTVSSTVNLSFINSLVNATYSISNNNSSILILTQTNSSVSTINTSVYVVATFAGNSGVPYYFG